MAHPDGSSNLDIQFYYKFFIIRGLLRIMTFFRACFSLFIFMLAINSPLQALAQDDPVVAIVNDIKILRSEIDDARVRLPERLRNVPLQSIFGMLVNSIIDTKLVASEARKINLQDDEQIRKRLARIEEQILERAFLTSYIEKRITEEMLAKSYDKLITANSNKEEIQARHILVENKAEALKAIKELEKGADFSELAKTLSTGPSASKGGDLGFFAEGQMVPSFSKAAFALKKGEITTQPVQTEFGWHVIKVENLRPLQPLKRADIEDQLREAVSRDIGAAYLQGLRQTAIIKRFNIDGSPLSETPPAQ